MKKLMIIFTLILISTAMFAVKFDPYWFQSRTIIGCFTKDAIPNIDGKIDFTIQDGVVKTGLSSFDDLAARFKIVDLKQAHSYVKQPEWNDKGMYLQHVYRIMLDSDEAIDAAVDALSKDINLHYAELETINRQKFVPNDPMLQQQYFHNVIRSFDAWDYTQGSHDVLVSITDSGVKWNHPDLRANIWINPAEAPGMTINWDAGTISGGNGQDAGEGGNKPDDLVGWDFYDNDNNPIQNYTSNYHGTHVAGCAGAVGNNAIGVVGSAPNVSILTCKGAPSNSASNGIAYGYDQIKYSAEIGADIINASWGGPGNGAYPNQIVNYATTLGSLVVTAAGNDNTEHNNSYQDYPADCPNALCVAATDINDYKASFSDYGYPIDICAPGQGILATVIGTGQSTQYDTASGTSMASPIVAGVGALVKSMHPNLTPQQLKDRLMLTADPIDEQNPNYIDKLGTGRVNAYTATMYDKIPNISLESFSISELSGDNDSVPNPGDTVKLTMTLTNPFTGIGIFWTDATQVEGRIRTNYPGVTIIDSVSVFGLNGTVFGGSQETNQTPFVFSTIAGLPSEAIPFELVVTANPDSDYPFNRTYPFDVKLSLVQQGWPQDTYGATPGSPILVDLNGDGFREVVYADQSGKVNAYNYSKTAQMPGFPVDLGSNTLGSIAMGKSQSSNNPFFAVNLNNNSVTAFSHTGQILFNNALGANVRGGAVIAKLNQNEGDKIFTITQNGNLHVFNQDGSYVSGYPTNIGGAYFTAPSAADINGDGNMEIVACSMNGTLNVISLNTGENIAGFPVTLVGGSQNPVIITDISGNGNGNPEIFITTSANGTLYAISKTGSIRVERSIGGNIRTNPVIADVNGDGNKEIIVITANGGVYIMDNAGNDLPGTPFTINANVESAPVVARFDRSNMAGIIFGDSNGYLHSVRVDGTESANFPIKFGSSIKVSAAITDLDNDGDIEIVFPDNENLYVVDIKRSAQSYDWTCYTGNYSRNGFIDGTVSNEDNLTPVVETELLGAFPNPFNPTTVINFNLKNAAKVSLDIYNQKGQKVHTLVDGNLPAGSHSYVWDGVDNKGNQVASGMYLYRMKSGKYSNTKKMILMK
jgi:subtilisin family serine protease